MFWRWNVLFLVLSTVLHFNQGCQMDGITNWFHPLQLQIVDIDRGIILNRQTSDISEIQGFSFTSDPPLNAGPYFNVSIINSEFIIQTNEEYVNYEENETRDSVSLIVNFVCSTGSTEQLVILISITDTNNNAPEFQPSTVFEFSITPPVPPGFLITDCLSGIIVRDIDLTTQRIDFTIEENDYFAIESSSGATNPKEFESIIKTTTLIRSLPDPIELTISATDVDLTEGPPITTNATIRIIADNSVFEFPDELVFSEPLYFANYTYDYEVELLTPVYLIQGYDDFVSFELDAPGYMSNFQLHNVENNIYIRVLLPLTTESIYAENIFLTIKANREYTSGASTVIVLQLPNLDSVNRFISFDKPNYMGTIENNTSSLEDIVLYVGYTEDIIFSLHGALSNYFDLDNEGGTVYLTLEQIIPQELLPSNNIIVLEIHASASNTITAYSTIIFELISTFDTPILEQLTFSNPYYVGGFSITNESITMDSEISLTQGYDETVEFKIVGEAAQWIRVVNIDNIVTFEMLSPVPAEEIINNELIVFIIEAQKTENLSTKATIILTDRNDSSDSPLLSSLAFDKVLYNGIIDDDRVQHDTVHLSGHTNELVEIVGEFAYLFDINVLNEEVVVVRSTVQFPTTLTIIALELHTGNAKAVLLLSVRQSDTDSTDPPLLSSLAFDKVLYNGIIDDDRVQHDTVHLSGHTNELVEIVGEFAYLFDINVLNEEVVVVRSTVQFPTTLTIIALELHTGNAKAVLLLSVRQSDTDSTDPPLLSSLAFDKVLYNGIIDDDRVQHDTVHLSGHTNELVEIVGEFAYLFDINVLNEEVVVVRSTVQFPTTLTIIALELHTGNAKAVLLLSVRQSDTDSTDPPLLSSLAFDKVLYNGIIDDDRVQHDTVHLSGHTNELVEIVGEFAYLFDINVLNEEVVVERSTVQFPTTLTIIALELHAGDVKAVLLLSVRQSDTDTSNPPTITFSSPSYVIQANVAQTGFVGQVFAISDNGEAINFSLLFDNVYLQQRISIDNMGLIHLSATVESGVFDFQIIATTVTSQANATAQVRLIVEAITVCGTEDNIVVPPLLVINRDEEQIHQNLAPVNYTENCHFVLTNRWPLDQTWLYVDEQGLHSRAIDREDPSIAHMALSQVQVELILYCDSAEGNRVKRSVNNARPEWLNQYDYGNNEWVLTETIQYNSKRMFVNLIVNDINDNNPIFIGKDIEPIVVGYPVPELIKSVPLRALTVLQATDADVGVNAAIMYWSSEPELAVSQNTGFVHIRDDAVIEDEQLFVVNATDQNGAGLTGSIQLKIRILNVEHIAVIAIQNIFLDEEENLLSNLTIAVGYDVKILNLVLAPEDAILSRKNYYTKNRINNSGISIRLFVYGLNNDQPITAQRLVDDIRNSGIFSIDIISSLTLKEHLETNETIITKTNVGLLVSTIVLSIALFILVALISVRFFLKWRRGDYYKKFSNAESVVSQNEVFDNAPSDTYNKPRIDMDQLRQSEKRLQSMLDSPVLNNEQSISSTVNTENTSQDLLDDIPPYNPNLPIVIQSIDKLKDAESDDEFGERRNTKPVVTFNENVEKFIHLEDMSPSNDGDAIYKF